MGKRIFNGAKERDEVINFKGFFLFFRLRFSMESLFYGACFGTGNHINISQKVVTCWLMEKNKIN